MVLVENVSTDGGFIPLPKKDLTSAKTEKIVKTTTISVMVAPAPAAEISIPLNRNNRKMKADLMVMAY